MQEIFVHFQQTPTNLRERYQQLIQQGDFSRMGDFQIKR